MKIKEFRRFLFMLTLFAGIFQHVNSQVLLYDNFDYPAGDSIIWHNWLTQQTNLTNAILVANGGLTYPGYLCSGIGNAASVGTTGQDVFRGFVKQTLPGTTLYMSCLAKVTTAATGDAFITFKESATSPTNLNYRGRVYAKVDGSNNLAFGISKGAITAPAVADYTPAIYSLNTTYLLVVRYNIVEGTANDSAFLFVNPVIGSPEPAPTMMATDIGATDVGLGSVLLRQGNTGASPDVIVDGVRVAKSWQLIMNMSDIATLSNIRVDGTSIFGFDPNTFNYNDTVPAGQTSVTVVGTTTDWASTQTMNLAATIPGVTTIIVTAENGVNTHTYTVNHAYNFHTVTVAASPDAGGTVSGGGVYGEGLNATVAAVPAANYMFSNWTLGGNIVSTSATYTFLVTGPADLVANFAPGAVTITAVASPPDGGTITGAGSISFGGTATLVAVAADAYDFYDWTENGTSIGTNPTLVLTNVTSNRNLVANFLIKTFTITVAPLPVEGGNVTGGCSLSYGGTATLSAAPNDGYIFENWTEGGNILGTDPILTLSNVTANHDVIANFIVSVNTFTVTGIAIPSLAGVISGSGNVTGGNNITLTATANQGYAFYCWTENGDTISRVPEVTITNVTSNHTLYALFLSTVGANEFSTPVFRVYPTLTSDLLNIESSNEIKVLQLIDMTGKTVLRSEPRTSRITIHTTGLADGFYTLRIITRKGMETTKILKVKE
jgi:hypothetical protein